MGRFSSICYVRSSPEYLLLHTYRTRTGYMRQNNELSQPVVLDNCTFQTAGKVKSDLLVLRYMTQKIHLHLLNLPPSTLLPSVDYVEERHNHIHRIVVYNQ